jgi:hypothetical protein
MASNISNYSQNIDTNFPVQGQDNPSQGFRDNFAQIKLALVTAADEIAAVQYLYTATNYTLPPATVGSLGGVQIDNVTTFIDGSGTLSVTPPYILPAATSSALGGVKVGANIAVGGDGTISVATPYTLPAATGFSLGGVKVGTGLIADGNGVLSVDNTVALPYALPVATNEILGAVKIGANIAIVDGFINVAAPYVLPPAAVGSLRRC